jgi:hypothetical protein
MLVELVLIVFLDIEHVVLAVMHVLTSPIDESAAAKGGCVSSSRINLSRRIKAVVKIGILIVNVYYVHVFVFCFRFLRITPQD